MAHLKEVIDSRIRIFNSGFATILKAVKLIDETVFSEYLKSLEKDSNELLMFLKAHMFAEYILNELLSEKVQRPGFFIKKSFSAKLSIIYNLGFLPSNIYKNLEKFSKIRNKFAHKLDYKLDVNELFFYDEENKIIFLKKENPKYSRSKLIEEYCLIIVADLEFFVKRHLHFKLKYG